MRMRLLFVGVLAAATLSPLSIELRPYESASPPASAAPPALDAPLQGELPSGPAAAIRRDAERASAPLAPEPAPPVFADVAPEQVPADLPAEPDPSVQRERFAHLQLDLADAETLEWNLFDDTRLRAERVAVEGPDPGGSDLTWHGRIEGDPTSEVLALIDGGRLTASIALSNGAVFTVDTLAPGLQRVREIDESLQPDCGNDTPEIAMAGPEAVDSVAPETTTASVAGGSDSIDVLLLYTAAARNAVGGSATSIEDRLRLVVDWANTIYANTGVSQRLRAAGVREVSYDDSHGSGRTALEHLTYAGDGFLEDVPALRDADGADMVALFTGPLDVCGIAWVASSAANIGWYSDYMFSVVNVNCTTSGKTFAHELGHNQGAYHDVATSLAQGMSQASIDAVPYPNSFGYIAPNGAFHTTMAYSSSCGGCVHLQQFSTPLLSYQGIATGNARADVRTTLEQTWQQVAQFHSAAPCTAQEDSDGDGMCDVLDNCILVANPGQVDSDLDGYGNACDADFDNDGVPGLQDYVSLAEHFGTRAGVAGYEDRYDLTGDGVVGSLDISAMVRLYGAAPGPSALACAGTAPCTAPGH